MRIGTADAGSGTGSGALPLERQLSDLRISWPAIPVCPPLTTSHRRPSRPPDIVDSVRSHARRDAGCESSTFGNTMTKLSKFLAGFVQQHVGLGGTRRILRNGVRSLSIWNDCEPRVRTQKNYSNHIVMKDLASPERRRPISAPWRCHNKVGQMSMSGCANGLMGNWSGRQDSNLRPSGPKPDALPGCATPRLFDARRFPVLFTQEAMCVCGRSRAPSPCFLRSAPKAAWVACPSG